MKKLSQNLFDRLINEFSSVELKKRVWTITIIGFILCIAVVIGGYFFFTSNFKVEQGVSSVPFWKLLWMGK